MRRSKVIGEEPWICVLLATSRTLLVGLLAPGECADVTVLIPLDVLKQMASLPKADRKRILEALEAVAAAPNVRQPFVTEMVGQPGVWRLRKGDWRAAYRMEGGNVVVIWVMHRREAYR